MLCTIDDRCLVQVVAHRNTSQNIIDSYLVTTGVLRVVPADAAFENTLSPPLDPPSADPPATDATAPLVLSRTTQQALLSHATLMPQLRTTLSDAGLTLPWPQHCPPRPQPPPAPRDEASSAPNLKTMVEEMARLRTQGNMLVQQQQECTMRRHAVPDESQQPVVVSGGTPPTAVAPTRSPARRPRRASPSPGACLEKMHGVVRIVLRSGAAAAAAQGVAQRLAKLQLLQQAAHTLMT